MLVTDHYIDELKAISLTMVAAGLDTLPGNINMTMAYLSSPHGQRIQKDAYAEIMKAYGGDDPWHEVSLQLIALHPPGI